MTHRTRLAVALLTIAIATGPVARADDQPASSELAETLRNLDVRVVRADSDQAKELPRMLGRDARTDRRRQPPRDRRLAQGHRARPSGSTFATSRIEAAAPGRSASFPIRQRI